MRSVCETRCEGGAWRGRAGAGGARREEASESEGASLLRGSLRAYLRGASRAHYRARPAWRL